MTPTPASRVQLIPLKQALKHRAAGGLMAFAVSLSIASLFAGLPAQGDALDGKWTAAREAANRLGDAAKDGDSGALEALRARAREDDATALHNLAWLHEEGVPALKLTKSERKACKLYGRGAALGYPPSQHMAGMCHMKKAPFPTAGGRYADLGLPLLQSAAAGGWTEAAVYLSAHYMRTFRWPGTGDPEKDKAAAAKSADYARMGLTSRPTDRQKQEMSYLLGMAALHGAPVDRREADEALRFAVDRGHGAAQGTLEALRLGWYEEIAARFGDLVKHQKSAIYRDATMRCIAPVGGKLTPKTRQLCRGILTKARAEMHGYIRALDYLDAHDPGNREMRRTLREDVMTHAKVHDLTWDALFFERDKRGRQTR